MSLPRALFILLLPPALLLLSFASVTAGTLDAPAAEGSETLAELLPLLRSGAQGIDVARFSPEENSHLDDVSRIWHASLWTLGGFLILLISLAPSVSWRSLRAGAILTLVLLLLGALIPFHALFTAFHGMFFVGDTWLFPPGSPMISMFPETFFFAVSVSIALRTAVLALLLLFAGLFARSRKA